VAADFPVESEYMGILRTAAVTIVAIASFLLAAFVEPATAQSPWAVVFPEQRKIAIRNPSDLPHIPLPDVARPATVSEPHFDAAASDMSLDTAIRTGLANSEVVRLLTGISATGSGSTIYDVAIANTAIDVQRGPFDPTVSVGNTWNRFEPPVATFDPLDPTRTLIDGTRTDNYDLDFELAKKTVTGGSLAMGVDSVTSRFRPGTFPLNPEERSSLDISFTQPLLQGGGVRANLAPILIARIETERSFFQFKDTMQEMVRGVIEAYWNLVFARTDMWARERQVEQSQFAYDLTAARGRVGDASGGDVAQTRLALANFRASLIAAKANVLQREAALRNVLGLPAYDSSHLVPITPPSKERLVFDWRATLQLAEQNRPDLIELKLILEADQQQLLIARNQALPRVDAVSLYRWNGLEGTMPNGGHTSNSRGEATDWTLGVNFSVPLGLRQARAQLRQRELIIARDRANLEQGLHNSLHLLALSVRNLDQYFEQYLAFGETRDAARDNLEQQMARYRAGLTQYINVLQAIVDWGSAVSSEAQSLALYNTELAGFEQQTGTILEAHGIRFLEERYGSIGPLGRSFPDQCYPQSLPPTPNQDRYPVTQRPAENFFDLEDPLLELKNRQPPRVEDLPPLPNFPPPTVPR
jgi:outer membrane protein TolC